MIKNNILYGPTINLNEKSFGKVIFESLLNGGSKIAMINAANNESKTYNDLLINSFKLVKYLQQLNVTKNDSIAICSENSLNYLIPVISSLFSGIIVAPVSVDLKEREMIHILNLSKPKIVFCSLKSYSTILKVSKQLDFIKNIVILDKYDGYVPNKTVKLENILKENVGFNLKPIDVDKNHNAVYLFSSGTTGLPKGVVLTHNNLNAAYFYNSHEDFGNFNSNKIGMAVAGFNFGFSLIRLLSMLIAQMKIIVLPTYKENLFLQAIQTYKVTNIFLTPPLVQILAKSPLVDNYDLSSVQEIMSGAFSLRKDIQEEACKRLKIKNVQSAYGLSETLAISFSSVNNIKTGSVGKPIPGRICKIIDTETGKILGPNEPGELCVKGPQNMKEYLNNPLATAETIDADGWCRTGDVAYYDNEGFLYIIDRYKELIKFKGYQVSPAEIEDLLLNHPDILECAVIGKPDLRVGELPTAFVVKRNNAKITEKDIIHFVAENISYQKQLHGGVIFIEKIPKNPFGKILRKVLREQLKSFNSKL